MIEYIVNEYFVTKIYQTEKIDSTKKSTLSVIKTLCEEHLFSYQGYVKAVQKQFGYKYQVPVYIDEDMQFFPIKRVRDYDNIWINKAAVQAFYTQGAKTKFLFYSGNILTVPNSLNNIEKQAKKLNCISKYIKETFSFLKI